MRARWAAAAILILAFGPGSARAAGETGELVLSATPVSAILWIGANRIGSGPVALKVASGNYVVTAAAPGWKPVSKTVRVDAKGSRVEVAIALSQKTAKTADTVIDPSAAELAAFYRGIRGDGKARKPRLSYRARGSGNVLEFSGVQLEASAKLAAIANALVHLAIERRGLTASAEGARLDENFRVGTAAFRVRAIHGGEEDSATITFEGTKKRIDVHVAGAVALRGSDDEDEAAASLDELQKKLDAMKIRARLTRSGSAHGAPIFEAMLDAPASLE